MKLQMTYEQADQIPDAYQDLYQEKNGVYIFTGIDGLKTQSDIDRLKVSLEKERDLHKMTKEKYAKLSSYDIEDVISKLDKYDELEIAASGKTKDNDKLLEARVQSSIAPLNRELEKLKKDLGEKDKVINEYASREKTFKIEKAMRSACAKHKIIDMAIDEVLLYGKIIFDVDDSGKVFVKEDASTATPGVSPEVWLSEMLEKKSHWVGKTIGSNSQSNGGGGYSGLNPFKKETWNMTEQAKMYKADPDKAAQMAKSAGVKLKIE